MTKTQKNYATLLIASGVLLSFVGLFESFVLLGKFSEFATLYQQYCILVQQK